MHTIGSKCGGQYIWVSKVNEPIFQRKLNTCCELEEREKARIALFETEIAI